ncbi:sensor histidine kinase [Streptomyces liliiviolaceus]|uniref:sensor histidine kinase n=1 Tax=Streptomyces liliiviolaceus TaxID=2823109 RepID=UPI001FFD2EFD|nr:HAMP domain-containing sensor histidine kinase [Streptomyces liliiviolaceus]
MPVLALATNWLLLAWFAKDLHAEQEMQLRSRATAITHNAEAYLKAVEANHPVIAENARRRLIDSALDVGFRLDAPDGIVEGGPAQDLATELPEEATEPVMLTTSDSGNTRWLVTSRRVTPSNGIPPDGPNLWMYSPDTAYQAQLSHVRERMWTMVLISVPVTWSIAWLIADRATRSLRRLQHRTSGLDPRITVLRLEHTLSGVTEVDDLARTLQTALARYDEQAARAGEALATARSFAAAASHEMRGPLTSLRTNLDILGEYPDLTAADREAVLLEMGQEQSRLLGLLGMLRTLAQGDLVEMDAFTRLDLAEVVQSSVADLRRTRPQARLTVTVASGLLVHAWHEGLRSAVDNLLVNAWTHGRAKDGVARIEVSLSPVHDAGAPAALLLVEDHGPGVPPASREEVFQRFLRSPDSPGSGLGLTLVAQQIALHQGRVAVLDRPDGAPGACFQVWLPVSGTHDLQHTLPLLRRDWLTAPDDEYGPKTE